jgi:hypothetical protein
MENLQLAIYLTWVALAVVVLLSISIYFYRTRKYKSSGQVHIGITALVAGVADVILFTWLTLTTDLQDYGWTLFIGFSIASYIGYLLIISFINCRVMYNSDDVWRINILGISKKYLLHEITVIFLDRGCFLEMGGKRHKYDSAYQGAEELKQFLERNSKLTKTSSAWPLKFGSTNERSATSPILGIVAITILCVALTFIMWNMHAADRDHPISFTVDKVVESDGTIIFYPEEGDVQYAFLFGEMIPEGRPLDGIATKGDQISAYAQYESGFQAADTVGNELYNLTINKKIVVSYSDYVKYTNSLWKKYTIYLVIGYIAFVVLFLVVFNISERRIWFMKRK